MNNENIKTRVALIAIIIEESESVDKLNQLLHDYREAIIGRMGIPYREKGISIISIAVDAPQDKINELTGKIGQLDHVSAVTAFSKKY